MQEREGLLREKLAKLSNKGQEKASMDVQAAINKLISIYFLVLYSI
jgi:hypothetical protein